VIIQLVKPINLYGLGTQRAVLTLQVTQIANSLLYVPCLLMEKKKFFFDYVRASKCEIKSSFLVNPLLVYYHTSKRTQCK